MTHLILKDRKALSLRGNRENVLEMQIYSCDLIAYCYRRTNTYIFHRKSILRLIILCLLFFLIKAGRIHKYFRSRVSTKLQSAFEISQTHLGLHKREIIL